MYQASAMAIGTLITLMLFANGSLQTAFGASRSLVIIHATGTLAVLVYLLAKRASFKTTEKIKPYLYLSGARGVLLVFFNITTVSSIGLTLTIAPASTANRTIMITPSATPLRRFRRR